MDEEGYGDFEYESTDLDAFLQLSVLRLFPAYYKYGSGTTKTTDPQALTTASYGATGATLTAVTVPYPERVFRVEDNDTLDPVLGWTVSGSRVLGVDGSIHSSVTVWWYGPATLADDDVTPLDVPDEFIPLVILGALIEALESKHDAGIIGQDEVGRRYAGVHEEMPVVDRLSRRYDSMRQEMALTLPTLEM